MNSPPSDASAQSAEIIKLDGARDLSPEDTCPTQAPRAAAEVLAQCVALLGQGWRQARLAADRRTVRDRAAEPRVRLRHERLEPGDLRRAGEARQLERAVHLAALFPAADRQRVRRDHPGLRPHDHAAALAGLAQQPPVRPLDPGRPLLPAQPDQRRPPEPRIPDRRRCPHRHRVAGRFRHRPDHRGAVGADVHHRALDHRRRADDRGRRHAASRSRASW